GPRYYELDESLHLTLSTLASREGRTENQLAADLLAASVRHIAASGGITFTKLPCKKQSKPPPASQR
ncbi:MAG: hypothetical protein Q8N45_11790, partial [Anaerolineales bacterium]|nr:hypothetical protein [Anaerolineales bacterium]